ncbi:MAG: metallophosphoesterase, partial [Polyangia bacterium]
MLGVLLGLHYYLWVRLVRDPRWPAPWGTVGAIILLLITLSIPVTFILIRRSSGAARLMAWPVFIWIGLMFLLVVTLAGSDLARAVLALARRLVHGQPVDPERRALFARWIAGGAVGVASTAGLGAMTSALGAVAVRRIEIPLRQLSRQHDGLSLVQLTDLHIGPTIGKDDLADVVRRTNQLRPDIIAITGDLVDGSVDQLRDAVSPLAQLKATHGVFFVTGNHEYFSGATAWVEELSRLGIRVLRNERVTIGEGEN